MNAKIATVSKKGIIKGEKKGKTTIVGTYKGLEFVVKVSVVQLNMNITINKTVKEDACFAIHIDSIKNGKIYFTVINKTDTSLNYYYGNIRVYIDGKCYKWEDELWGVLDPNEEVEESEKLVLAKDGYVTGENGQLKMNSYYFFGADDEERRFDINVNIK